MQNGCTTNVLWYDNEPSSSYLSCFRCSVCPVTVLLHFLVCAAFYSGWGRQRWPENKERPDLARRSLHLYGSDGGGQRHSLRRPQSCRSVPACLASDNHKFCFRIINLIFFIASDAVPGVPGPPGVIRVEEIGDTWVKLLWTKGSDHNSPILSYTIQTRFFWALNEDDWRDASTCEYYYWPVGGAVAVEFGLTTAQRLYETGLVPPTVQNSWFKDRCIFCPILFM